MQEAHFYCAVRCEARNVAIRLPILKLRLEFHVSSEIAINGSPTCREMPIPLMKKATHMTGKGVAGDIIVYPIAWHIDPAHAIL